MGSRYLLDRRRYFEFRSSDYGEGIPILAYISHAYSAESEAERLQNVNASIDAALELWKLGIHSLIPNLSHFVDLRSQEKGIEISWESFLLWDLELLKGCDCLLLLGDSPGCIRERNCARELGMRIFTSVEDVILYSKRVETLKELARYSQEIGLDYGVNVKEKPVENQG